MAQAFVVVGDYNGHVGLGVKCAKEVCPCPATPLPAGALRPARKPYRSV